jgi:non-specific protein-tyrosine kinase
VDWRRQLSALRGWLLLLVVIGIGSAAIAYGVSAILPKTYAAKATLIVGQSLSNADPDYTQLLASQRLSATYARLATTNAILEKVNADLGLSRTPMELQRSVVVSSEPESTLITIAVTDPSATVAANIANAIASDLIVAAPAPTGLEAELKAFIDKELQTTQADIQSTQTEVERLLAIEQRTLAEEAQLSRVQDRLATLRSSFATLLQFASGQTANILSIIDPAVAVQEPVAPRPLLNAFLAGLLAVLVAVFLILVLAYLDDGLKNADVVHDVLDLPTVGVIPLMQGKRGGSEIYRLTMLLFPRSPAAEAFRTLRTNLEFTSVDAPVSTILVTSAAAGDGKTVVASNLAVAFAQAGQRVLLVDADLRKPGVQAIFNVPGGRGLSDLLRTNGPDWQRVVLPTEEANLTVLTAGPLPPNPAELLDTQRMRTLLEKLKAAHDIVIVDAPPLLPVADASILSTYVDGTLLVVDARRTRKDAARRAREALARAGARSLGVVIDRIRGGEEALYGAYYA